MILLAYNEVLKETGRGVATYAHASQPSLTTLVSTGTGATETGHVEYDAEHPSGHVASASALYARAVPKV